MGVLAKQFLSLENATKPQKLIRSKRTSLYHQEDSDEEIRPSKSRPTPPSFLRMRSFKQSRKKLSLESFLSKENSISTEKHDFVRRPLYDSVPSTVSPVEEELSLTYLADNDDDGDNDDDVITAPDDGEYDAIAACPPVLPPKKSDLYRRPNRVKAPTPLPREPISAKKQMSKVDEPQKPHKIWSIERRGPELGAVFSPVAAVHLNDNTIAVAEVMFKNFQIKLRSKFSELFITSSLLVYY